MENKAPVSNLGEVVSVRGSVVDIRFANHLPPIYTLLRAGAEAKSPLRLRPNSTRIACAGLR